MVWKKKKLKNAASSELRTAPFRLSNIIYLSKNQSFFSSLNTIIQCSTNINVSYNEKDVCFAAIKSAQVKSQ